MMNFYRIVGMLFLGSLVSWWLGSTLAGWCGLLFETSFPTWPFFGFVTVGLVVWPIMMIREPV